MQERWFSIGEIARRAGVATSALRFYEDQGLIGSVRDEAGRRQYKADVWRRIAFIRIAQRVGVSLDEIREALESLPAARTPTKKDWARLSRLWRARLDERIASLTGLRDELTDCIGCGCLSLKSCALYNPEDRAATLGTGPRYLLGDRPADIGAGSTPAE